MSSRPPEFQGFGAPLLELLEQRIAPAAVINVGAPLNSEGVPAGDPSSYNYKYAPPDLPNPFTLLGTDPDGVSVYGVDLAKTKASDAVQQIKLFNVGEAFQPWITINSGVATAFFRDANRNNVVESNELSGVSFTDKLNLNVDGSIFGDVVGNGAGTGNSLAIPSGASITSLKVSGSVLGSVVGAGNISNVEIAGTVERISTASGGDIAFNLGLGEQTLKAYVPPAGVAGGSLNNLKVGDLRIVETGGAILPGIVATGDGGASAAGGSIAKITVTNDNDGLSIFSGSGGSGVRGGAGGAISSVLVYGAGDAPLGVLPGLVRIEAGDGGAGTAGPGGAGGAVSAVSIGYEPISGKVGPSPQPSATPVFVSSGDGGDGSRGGVGGTIKDLNVLINASDRDGIDEISVLAGTGGAGTASDGAGGAISALVAQNVFFNLVDPDADRDSIIVRGGSAGEGAGEGGKGGAVSKLSLLSDRIEVFAGAGSAGQTRGGLGGSLSNVEIISSESEQARVLNLRGGEGGDAGASGRAGAGGAVSNITANYVDLRNDAKFVEPSTVSGGQGGSGIGPGAVALVGGAGGSISKVRIFEPTDTEEFARLRFLGGDGGLGSRSGGIGGGISGVTFIGFATSPSAQAGQGGNATAGAGGAGGSLRDLVLRSDWVLGQGADTPNVTIAAGNGGNGSGASGAGGAGGSAVNVNVRVSGPLGITAFSQDYLNATPDAPATITWQQFNPATEKASLVDVRLRITGAVQGSFDAENLVPSPAPPLPNDAEIVLNGATSGLFASFSGGGQVPAKAVAPVVALPLVYEILPSVVPPDYAALPANLENGQRAVVEVGEILLGVFTPVRQTLTPLETDLLSTEQNSEPFFSGPGTVTMQVGQEFKTDYVVFGKATREDLGTNTDNLSSSGQARLTYRYMDWVDVGVVAGDGGSGFRSVGAGGALSKVFGVTLSGDSLLEAGDAGNSLAGTTRGAAGGSISSAYIAASNDVSALAGDGQAGGKGGSISGLGWQKNTLDAKGNLDGATAPLGTVIIQAGHGSALGNAAGAGGSVTNSGGFSSSSESASVRIMAGDGSGAGGGTATRGSAGGSVSSINIFGGEAAPQFVGGFGGNATAGAGGAGGSVSSVTVAPGLDILQLAAGDGGDGTSRGGVGGSVIKINAFADIGERSGKNFGFDTEALDGAGGIFAGAGGNGPSKGKAGSVTDVTAAAISSIVAGRPTSASPQTLQLANLVDRIYLRDLRPPTVESSPVGSFSLVTAPAELPSTSNPFGKPSTTAFASANLVGSISGDPYAAGANVFKLTTGPIDSPTGVSDWTLGTTAPRDGLIAAISLGQNKNFRPEALLTATDPRNPVQFVLFDYRNNFNANS